MLGSYRCVAKNKFGQHEIFIEFQRPGLPDPPTRLEAINITHASFVVVWQGGYDGGSNQIYHVVLNGYYTEDKYTPLNSVRFQDLHEKSQYTIKIRSKNHFGFSNYSTQLVIVTKESPVLLEKFPILQQAYYTQHDHRIYFQLNLERSTLLSNEQLCLQYYNDDEMSACIPFTSQLLNDGIEINIDQKTLRLKLCLINQTDVCSKSISISTRSQSSSDYVYILIGKNYLLFVSILKCFCSTCRRNIRFMYCFRINYFIYLYSST